MGYSPHHMGEAGWGTGTISLPGEVYRDVLGHRGNKLPVTTVIADLSNPKDVGLKKAVARVKRATKRRSP